MGLEMFLWKILLRESLFEYTIDFLLNEVCVINFHILVRKIWRIVASIENSEY